MADTKEIAEEMKFMWRCKNNDCVDGFIFNSSLRAGSIFGLIMQAIIEILFHYVIISYWTYQKNDILYLIMVLISILRLGIFGYCYKAINTTDFDMCLKATYAIQLVSLFQYLNTCIIGLAMVCQMDILGRTRDHPIEYVSFTVLAVLMNSFSVYVAYLVFSFTKHLGLGNLDLINGLISRNAIPNAHIPTSGYGNITTLVIGQNLTNTDINLINTGCQFNSLEKIVLTDPRDLLFAQSAHEAIVNGMTLPSGVRVPYPSDSRAWKIVGNEIILK
jgi:hypothetical protein